MALFISNLLLLEFFMKEKQWLFLKSAVSPFFKKYFFRKHSANPQVCFSLLVHDKDMKSQELGIPQQWI